MGSTYSPEILAAVAVLDKDQPGWHRKIDLDRFALNFEGCVLSQVYGAGDVNEFADQLNRIDPDAALGLAFCEHSAFPRTLGHTDQWRSLIAERQDADQIGRTLSIPDIERDEIEGVAV